MAQSHTARSAITLGALGCTFALIIALVGADDEDEPPPERAASTASASFVAYTTSGAHASKPLPQRADSVQKIGAPPPPPAASASPPAPAISATRPPSTETDVQVGLANLVVIGAPAPPTPGDEAQEPDDEGVIAPLVVGPDRWMAQRLPEETAALDTHVATVDASVQRTMAAHSARQLTQRAALSEVRAISRACHTLLAPQLEVAEGRLLIGVEALISHRVATVTTARIEAAVYLKDRRLHRCIIQRVQGMQLPIPYDDGALHHMLEVAVTLP